MNGKCLEMGAIQAFLDGETSPAQSLVISDHIADCDRCAALLALAEEETAVVFSALERELNTLVPTQRLWNRINESIAEEKSRMPVWQRALGFLSGNIATPSFASAFGLLIVFGMIAAVMTYQPDMFTSQGPIADHIQPPAPVPSKAPSDEVVVSTTGSDAMISPAPAAQDAERDVTFVRETNLPAERIRRIAAESNIRQPVKAVRTVYTPEADAAPGYLPGEESYVKTIADLKQSVDGQKDEVMSPSSRVSFERDLAVVNDSIKRMQDAVRKNPRNQAAKQILYSSYQDKIDLLNSVAQREELMASLR
jgi:anti-sigma factor RsiW